MVDAIREYLSTFNPPGESQIMERFMFAFSLCYYKSNPTYFQKQYVYSDKKNKRIPYVARSFKVKLACLGFRLVQKRKWEHHKLELMTTM